MQKFIGLDVSQKLTHICVVDLEGRFYGEGLARQHQKILP